MTRNLIAAGVATIVVMALAYLGITERLGAHPFWSVRIGFLGLLPGLIAAIGLHFLPVGNNLKTGLGLAGVATAFGVARWGAARFSASYAEDVGAGKLWFFGWIATMAGIFLVTYLLVRRIAGDRS